VQDLERQQIVKAMEDAKGVQAKAAKMLGITPRQLGYRLRKYGLAS
jgi:Nif-specific regulatory protein